MKHRKSIFDTLCATGAVALCAVAFHAAPAAADSTVSIPVPDSVTNESKNLVLTITVPTSLERTYQQQQIKKDDDKPKKKNFSKYFDMSPFPNMVNKDELEVLKRFTGKRIIDDITTTLVTRGYVTNNYEMGRAISSVVASVLRMQPEELAKAKVTRTDILDLVKVFDNYTKELKMFNVSGKDRERLTKVSQKLSFTDGEVKVVKVETNDIGGTVIHMTLNNVKGKYQPQYISKLEPLPQSTGEVNMAAQPPANLTPDNLQFTSGQPTANQQTPQNQLPPPPDPPVEQPTPPEPPPPDPNGGTPTPAPDPNAGGGGTPLPPPDAPPAP